MMTPNERVQTESQPFENLKASKRDKRNEQDSEVFDICDLVAAIDSCDSTSSYRLTTDESSRNRAGRSTTEEKKSSLERNTEKRQKNYAPHNTRVLVCALFLPITIDFHVDGIESTPASPIEDKYSQDVLDRNLSVQNAKRTSGPTSPSPSAIPTSSANRQAAFLDYYKDQHSRYGSSSSSVPDPASAPKVLPRRRGSLPSSKICPTIIKSLQLSHTQKVAPASQKVATSKSTDNLPSLKYAAEGGSSKPSLKLDFARQHLNKSSSSLSRIWELSRVSSGCGSPTEVHGKSRIENNNGRIGAILRPERRIKSSDNLPGLVKMSQLHAASTVTVVGQSSKSRLGYAIEGRIRASPRVTANEDEIESDCGPSQTDTSIDNEISARMMRIRDDYFPDKRNTSAANPGNYVSICRNGTSAAACNHYTKNSDNQITADSIKTEDSNAKKPQRPRQPQSRAFNRPPAPIVERRNDNEGSFSRPYFFKLDSRTEHRENDDEFFSPPPNQNPEDTSEPGELNRSSYQSLFLTNYVSAHQQYTNAFNTNPWSVVSLDRCNEGLRDAVLLALENPDHKRLNTSYKWIGSLGMPSDDLCQERKDEIDHYIHKHYKSEIVWLSDETLDGAYDHYCRTILWPLLHYQIAESPTSQYYQDHTWKHLVKLSKDFASKICKEYREGDVIWVNDYHLLLVPKLIREKIPGANICFFMHVSFPSSEVFRCLAKRKELLEGVIASNVVGFQTEDYKLHFMRTCSRILSAEIETSSNTIVYNQQVTNVFSVPIGLDVEACECDLYSETTQKVIEQLKKRYKGKNVILARDRLSRVRGVRQKLLSYELFLKKYPEFRSSTILIQLGWGTDDRSEPLDEMSEIVERINSSYSDLATLHQPVIFMRKLPPPAEHIGLMSIADCFLVTSRREGMNLSSHEYIVAQTEKKNPLILSEFVGSANIFNADPDNGAIIINPWDTNETADAIYHAFTLSKEEKERRYRYCFQKVKQNDASYWLNFILDETARRCAAQHQRIDDSLVVLSIDDFLPQWRKAKTRLLFIDYEGTLANKKTLHQSGKKQKNFVIKILNKISRNPRNLVYLSSSQSASSLDSIFSNCPRLGLIAENGCFIKPAHVNCADEGNGRDHQDGMCEVNTNLWTSHLERVSLSCLAKIREAVSFFSERIQGSYVLNSQVRTELHCEDADDENFAQRQAAEVANHLNDTYGIDGWRAVLIDKVVCVEPIFIDKATAAESIFEHHWPSGSRTQPDFIMAFGNDRNDEHLFSWVNQQASVRRVPTAVTVHVGLAATHAKACIFGISTLLEWLQIMMQH